MGIVTIGGMRANIVMDPSVFLEDMRKMAEQAAEIRRQIAAANEKTDEGQEAAT